MFPVYRGMNSYPCQRNKMSSSQYYYPSWEAVPPQMKENPSSSSCNHESWSHYFGYPDPPKQCHNCYTHGQHPAYYNFRPPCSHLPPPPPPPTYNHFCGGYPSCPQPYPMYYAPPPHYSMELPRYEFDKSVPRDQFHCCGCPNHSCQVKGRNTVKIEEQEPDAETNKSESSFPAGANNFSHPILWVPHGLTTNNEYPRKLVENEKNEQQVLPYMKPPQVQKRFIDAEARDNEKSHPSVQSVEEDPNLRYGWFPLDMNSIKQLMEGGDTRNRHDQEKRSRDEKKACDAENKDQNKQQLSCPIFWMPYDNRLVKDDHLKSQVENSAGGTAAGESPSSLNIVPRKMCTDNEEGKGRPIAEGGDSRIGTVGAEKKSNVKTIPVIQLEESVPNLSKKEEEHKVDGAQVGTVKPSSPTKKSKLPPICLRVDPPKKKSGNGSSRSPSPPGDKKQQDFEKSNKEMKVKDLEEKTLNQNKLEVSHGVGEAAGAGGEKVAQQADSDKTEDAKRGVEDKAKGQEPQAEKESKSLQESKKERNTMSETEAAVIIQSAYRGYGIRRWEPLEKLQEIAKVREEAMKVKKQIEDLESCDAIDVKEKAIVGETIMKLLLKLDTIPGLHQSIRDVRRSVAKELITLQEKLDSIMSQKSTIPSHQDTSTAQAYEGNPKFFGSVEGSEISVESVVGPSKVSSLDGDKIAKAFEGEGISSNVLSSGQLPPCQSVVCGLENKEMSEPLQLVMDSQREPQDDIVVSKPSVGIDDQLSENREQEANLLSKLPEEVVEKSLATVGPVENIAVQNDVFSGDKDQEEESLPLELPQAVNKGSLAHVSFVDSTEVQTDMVAGDEDQKAVDIPCEVSREAVEEDEKEILQAEQDDLGSSKLTSSSEEQLHDDANGDGEELAEVETLANLNEDLEVGQPSKTLEAGNEDIVVIEHENHSPLELSSQETVLQQGESKLQGSTGEEKASEVEPGVRVPPLKEIEDEVMKESSETSETTLLTGPISDHENVTELLTSDQQNESETLVKNPEISNNKGVTELLAGDQENESETLKKNPEISNNKDVAGLLAGDQENESETLKQELAVPEPSAQQSEEEEEASGKSMEDQSSVVAAENGGLIDQKIMQETEKLRELLEKLLASGKEQLEVLSSLNGKVKDLEKKLAKKRQSKSAKHLRVKGSRPLCRKPVSGSLRERPMGIAS